jgi:hypothetical protein
MLRLLDNSRLIRLPVPLLLAAMAVLWAADQRTAFQVHVRIKGTPS